MSIVWCKQFVTQFYINQNNEPYIVHLFHHWLRACQFAKGVFYSIVHGVCPLLFQTDSDEMICELYFQHVMKKDIMFHENNKEEDEYEK